MNFSPMVHIEITYDGDVVHIELPQDSYKIMRPVMWFRTSDLTRATYQSAKGSKREMSF